MSVRPLCFMIMPFGRKPTQAPAGKGPAEINFNALWDRAYVPAIEALGYEPVRADQDVGSLIVNQMLERIYFADLVLADMTIPNGNVYYEVGVRHASQEKGCVLLSADWATQLFDVAQMRSVRYPLAEGEVVESTAAAIQQIIKQGVPSLRDGQSPMYEVIRGYPNEVDPTAASSMKSQQEKLAAFQAKVRAVRASPRAERMKKAYELVQSDLKPPIVHGLGLGTLAMLRDCVQTDDDWRLVLAFIDEKLGELAAEPLVSETRALALSKLGKPEEAIGLLEKLVEGDGATAERLGLLGGRYKQLEKSATDPVDKARYLARAIECYEKGMDLDLNDYYCSSNLPRLYRARNKKGDQERAQTVLHVVISACERAKKRNAADEWLRPTLLGAAFDAGDVDKAEDLAEEVKTEGAARWKINSTLADLERSANQVPDAAKRERLLATIEEFKRVG